MSALLCSIGKATYTWPLQSNAQDIEVYRSLVQTVGLGRVYLIVQAERRRFTVGHSGSIVAIFIPRLRSQALNYLWFVLWATRIGLRLARQGVRVFQASEPSAGGIAGALIKIMTGARLIVHLQGDLFNLPRLKFPWWRRAYARYITALVSRKADRVRCVSQALLRAATEAGVEPGKLVLVPSRCDTARFDPDRYASDRHRLREGWGVSPDAHLVLFVGSLTVHKGISYLLQALKEVTVRNLNIILLLVGSGELEHRLQEEAGRLSVAARVRFCGWIPHDELPRFMAAADFFVLPSLDEGLPRALLEAMAMRLPVIASGVGGVPELVRHGDTGLLVEPANPGQIADAISYALKNPNAADVWSRRAREVVELNYSYRVGIHRYGAMISELLTQGGQLRLEP